jgi:hypothetical protein
MKKPIVVVLVVMAVMLLTGSSFVPAHAQDIAKEEKPTFYRLTPGVYVNGWPRFTLTYPKDWVERHLSILSGEVFRVSPPGSADLPTFRINLLSPYIIPPLDKYADYLASLLRTVATDVTVISDKPSQLRDGTPAREIGIKHIVNGVLVNSLTLITKKGDLCVLTAVASPSGRMGEDPKSLIYSIEFQPGKDEPVKVPPDVQEFLDRNCRANVAHDVGQLMATYSDKYLNSGMRKVERERLHRQMIGAIKSFGIGVVDFIADGDRAYLAGFIRIDLPGKLIGKLMLQETSIIKESGEWKWYGNQRDVVP